MGERALLRGGCMELVRGHCVKWVKGSLLGGGVVWNW